jgi:hypothetical protein
MLKRSLEKGTTVERLKITQRSAFLLGQKFDFRARISAPGLNFRGPESPEFPSLQNLAKSFTLCCSATLSKGAGNSGIGRIFGGRKFHNFCPCKIRLSPLLRGVVQLTVRGPEILIWPEFRPCDFSLSPFTQAVVQLSVKGKNFRLEFSAWKFPGAGISAPRPEFPP